MWRIFFSRFSETRDIIINLLIIFLILLMNYLKLNTSRTLIHLRLLLLLIMHLIYLFLAFNFLFNGFLTQMLWTKWRLKNRVPAAFIPWFVNFYSWGKVFLRCSWLQLRLWYSFLLSERMLKEVRFIFNISVFIKMLKSRWGSSSRILRRLLPEIFPRNFGVVL